MTVLGSSYRLKIGSIGLLGMVLAKTAIMTFWKKKTYAGKKCSNDGMFGL